MMLTFDGFTNFIPKGGLACSLFCQLIQDSSVTKRPAGEGFRNPSIPPAADCIIELIQLCCLMKGVYPKVVGLHELTRKACLCC